MLSSLVVPQPPPLQPRRMRPLAPAQEMLAAASAKVLSWARQRVRDDVGLEKLLHEAALVRSDAQASLCK
jgi:hypothetical protein